MQLFRNPVLVKELRGRIRGSRAMLILTIYLSVIGAVTLLLYLAMATSFENAPSNLEAGRTIGRYIFLTVMTVAMVQVCIITPSLTAGSIAGEKERQSYDLLITTLLSPLQIALGKLAAALAYAMLLIVAVLPMAGLAFLFGGVSGAELALGMVGLVVTAVLYATVGLFWSTVMRTTLGATVMSQGMIILSLLGIPFIFGVVTALVSSSLDDEMAVLYVYTMGALLCTHPFIALGMTAGFLSSGYDLFFFELPVSGQDILVPQPWLAYTFITVVLTAFFLFLSVRLLKPVQYERQRPERQTNAQRS